MEGAWKCPACGATPDDVAEHPMGGEDLQILAAGVWNEWRATQHEPAT